MGGDSEILNNQNIILKNQINILENQQTTKRTRRHWNRSCQIRKRF